MGRSRKKIEWGLLHRVFHKNDGQLLLVCCTRKELSEEAESARLYRDKADELRGKYGCAFNTS